MRFRVRVRVRVRDRVRVRVRARLGDQGHLEEAGVGVPGCWG